jgi:alkanesulfonate monooxygenase SsuD/methylene tetrahydromethanopterin reductase-like flavin-dependent oxidoreductase (luciferase family)
MNAAPVIATTPWQWNAATDVSSLCQQARTAEDMGFHCFWLPENHFRGRSSIPAPLMLLAAVAACTSTIRLGCVSYLLPIRNPLLAAEEVAVLDQLSDGRLILGLGRGTESSLFRAFAIDSADKRVLFGHHLDIMRRAWRGEPVLPGEDGKGIVLSPLPRQRPCPPLWVAAFGPKALRQVAELGLPYLASPLESLNRLRENYGIYHRCMQEAGLPAVVTIPIMRTVFACEDRRQLTQLRARLATQIPAKMRHPGEQVDDWAIIGTAHEVGDRIGELQQTLGMTHLILRGGLPGVGLDAQLNSHARVVELARQL